MGATATLNDPGRRSGFLFPLRRDRLDHATESEDNACPGPDPEEEVIPGEATEEDAFEDEAGVDRATAHSGN